MKGTQIAALGMESGWQAAFLPCGEDGVCGYSVSFTVCVCGGVPLKLVLELSCHTQADPWEVPSRGGVSSPLSILEGLS